MKIFVAGRFVTRGSGPDGQGPVDLILGVGMKSNDLMPNTVYEIMSIDGELTLRTLGPSCNMNSKAWMLNVNSIIEEKFPRAILTQAEAEKINGWKEQEPK